MSPVNIHANCVVIGTKGILIRGDSGAGKSVLTERLAEAARVRGNFAALVADDRVLVTSAAGRLAAAPPETIKGQMEVRGFGIVGSRFLGRAQIHLIVDLAELKELERLPENPVTFETVEGIALPRVVCPQNAPDAALRLIRWGFRYSFPQCPDYF